MQKSLVRPMKKREKTQVHKIRNERGEITTDITELKS